MPPADKCKCNCNGLKHIVWISKAKPLTSGSVDSSRQYMYARSRKSGLSVSTVALFKTTCEKKVL